MDGQQNTQEVAFRTDIYMAQTMAPGIWSRQMVQTYGVLDFSFDIESFPSLLDTFQMQIGVVIFFFFWIKIPTLYIGACNNYVILRTSSSSHRGDTFVHDYLSPLTKRT